MTTEPTPETDALAERCAKLSALNVDNANAFESLCRQLERDRNRLQAKIDALMLEYCPDEMTREQVANWQANQRPATAEETAAIEAALAPVAGKDREDAERPTIVCLCGSTRFKDAFDEAIYSETMAGRIVLSVGFYMHATGNRHGEDVGATPEQKIALDELHKRKIDLADEVLILNVGGYVGSSTQSELDYAIKHGKRVRWLDDASRAKD